LVRVFTKLVYWIVAAIVIVLAVIVAVANRDAVILSFDPLPVETTLPLYAVVFSSISIGLVLGAVVGAWSTGQRWRRKRRAAKAEQASGSALIETDTST
jgi:uncharacterized integral membrane protein